MLRTIKSEKLVKENHTCNVECLRVERLDNPYGFESKIYCTAMFNIPLGDEEYIKDVERLLRDIIYNLDDRIIDIYKR